DRPQRTMDSANLTVLEVSSKMRPVADQAAWPRRLEAQDTALSRPRHGFESRRGQLVILQGVAASRKLSQVFTIGHGPVLRLRLRAGPCGWLLHRILQRSSIVVFSYLRVVGQRRLRAVAKPLGDYMNRECLCQLRFARGTQVLIEPWPRFHACTAED